MSIKNWKKVKGSKNHWIGKKYHVYVDSFPKYKEYHFILSDLKFNLESEKIFKSKAQALAYAKAYMRRH